MGTDALYWAAAVLLLGLLVFTVFGDQGLMDLKRLQGERDRLVEQNARQEAENRMLSRTVERLQHDPGFMEQIARRELGMVREDEYVIKFRE